MKKRQSFCLLIAMLLVFMTGTGVWAEDDTRGLGDGLFGAILEGMFSQANSSAKTNMRNVTVDPIPDQTYTGKAITPTVKVSFWGSRLKRGTDYTLTFSNNRSVGTAKVVIKGKGDFTGSKTVSFKIVKKNGSSGNSSSGGSSKKKNESSSTSKKFNVKLSTTVYTYNGRFRKPSVTVTAGSKKITAKYYTVKYFDNRSVGDATVKVTGKGDYKGYSGEASFRIDLKKASLASVKATGDSQIKVTWRKDTQADGYQIEYSTRKSFGSGTKNKMVRNGNKTTEDLNWLVNGKKYYVRVRSYKKVGSRNRYSEWSTVRNATVKE